MLRTVSRLFRINVLLHLRSFRIGLVVQDVPRDAFQHLAEFVKRSEADCTPFPCFEQGKVGKGNADDRLGRLSNVMAFSVLSIAYRD